MIVLGSITQVHRIEDATQIGSARRLAQQIAQAAGFDDTDAGRVALLATELASNVYKHAGRGELHMRPVPGRGVQGVEIVALDRGPGFDISICLADGYSTGGTQGIGLGALSRMAQVFDAYADAHGSAVLVRLYPGRTPRSADMPWGISHHAYKEDEASGDQWCIAFEDKQIAALVIDGLGHGIEAARAAEAGVARFVQDPMREPGEQLTAIHQAMMGSRGGAVAIARHDAQAHLLHFAGVGNISASLEQAERSRGIPSHPGIVGVQYRALRVLDFPQTQGQLLIMHSDGLQTRWRLRDYPGLWRRHPALIAALLYRDFNRGRDDVCVLVAALETRA